MDLRAGSEACSSGPSLLSSGGLANNQTPWPRPGLSVGLQKERKLLQEAGRTN